MGQRAIYWLKRLGPALLILILLGAALLSGLPKHLTPAELTLRKDWLEAAVIHHPFQAASAYLAFYIVYVALCLPGLVVVSVMSGFLFGLLQGSVICVLGDTLGASAVFLASRSAFGDILRRRAGATVARLEQGISAHGAPYILAVRLMPPMPFWLVNIAAGCLSIRLRTFALATAVGIYPACLLFSQLGVQMRVAADLGQPISWHFFGRPGVYVPLVALGLLAVVPLAVIALRARKKKDADTD